MPISKSISDLARELATTRRTLERYPDGRGDWKPHAKSKSLGELASHVASIPGYGVSVMTQDKLDFATRKPTPTLDSARELLAEFDARAAVTTKAVESASEADLEKRWSMVAGDHVIGEGTRREMFRSLVLSHLIHHRAQLGVYYRLLGVPVPSMYGPSADEQ
jgi:uncharacterized damage-inducible protein DinB